MHSAETHSTHTIADRLTTMTLAEAIAMAMDFETSAARFYRDLALRIPPEPRSLALELAEEEEKHYAMLQTLATDSELALHLNQRIQSPSTTPAIESYITLRILPDAPYEDDLLDYARTREEVAREHYGYLAELAPAGPLQDLFRYMEIEEQKHADHISDRWAELFSVI